MVFEKEVGRGKGESDLAGESDRRFLEKASFFNLLRSMASGSEIFLEEEEAEARPIVDFKSTVTPRKEEDDAE